MTEAPFNDASSGRGGDEPIEGKPIVRDRRRIDPETGEVREPRPEAAAPAAGPDPADVDADVEAGAEAEAGVQALETALAERTADLQRLQAEYVNYKRRVDRDREAVREASVGTVLSAMLPVLDDIDRAREHGELEGGFKAVADSLDRTVHGLGLVRFGEPGEEFDPRVHEALMHAHSEDVDRPTCQAILQPGYRIGERVLRPARVSVVEPGGEVAPSNDVPDGDD
ncbi:MAG TPA: nucleotide exchange factor GrpE [Nocardioidaceae bacterium]|nr:nucleotide exchange factor GrpE [Nocardioidaceae bacterium]